MLEEVIAVLAVTQRTRLYSSTSKKGCSCSVSHWPACEHGNLLQPPEHFLTFTLGPPGPTGMNQASFPIFSLWPSNSGLWGFLREETEKALAPHSSTLAWKNPMDGGAWWDAVHGFEKSRTRLSDFTVTFHFHALEKEMATHSSVPAWSIPGTAEPGGLAPTGSHRVGHAWSALAAAAAERGEGTWSHADSSPSLHTGSFSLSLWRVWNSRVQPSLGARTFRLSPVGSL